MRHDAHKNLQIEARGKNKLSAADLEKLGPGAGGREQDEMSEFSVLSGESDIGAQQNVLDLRVAKV